MKTLVGIILFHYLVLLRAKRSAPGSLPWLSLILLSLCLIVYVVWMMQNMEVPVF